jgi:cytosine/adenosine deaminase-related metal-dependent hydrolase
MGLTMKITNAWICTINNNGINPVYGDLLIDDETIKKIIPKKFNGKINRTKSKSGNTVDAGGRVITIPFVNFHDHIYSRLAKGVTVKGPTNNFQNILKNLWWKLDKALDMEMIKASAQMASIESIKNGVTYIFDHHSSPNYAKGSLVQIAKVLKKNNIRSVLAFETTDRNSGKLSLQGIEENKNFFLNYTGQNIKSMFGLHASFTLNNTTLKTVSEFVNEYEIGIHIHLCEDPSDRKITKSKTGMLPLQRLKKFNLLNEKSILSHAIHLTASEFGIIEKYKSAVAINIDSNMNNAVGITKMLQMPESLTLLAGTDGMHANPKRTLKNIFLLLRNSGASFDEAFKVIQRIYFNQIDFIKHYFNDFTQLKQNNRADFIIWDYIPPTPFNKNNFWGHFIYGMLESNIHSTFQNGKALMTGGKLSSINEEKSFEEIYKQGKRLFGKMKRLK